MHLQGIYITRDIHIGGTRGVKALNWEDKTCGRLCWESPALQSPPDPSIPCLSSVLPGFCCEASPAIPAFSWTKGPGKQSDFNNGIIPFNTHTYLFSSCTYSNPLITPINKSPNEFFGDWDTSSPNFSLMGNNSLSQHAVRAVCFCLLDILHLVWKINIFIFIIFIALLITAL